MQVTKRIDMDLLVAECATAGVNLPRGLGYFGTDANGNVHTYDGTGAVAELPAEAIAVVNTHTAPAPPVPPDYGADGTTKDQLADAVRSLRQYIALASPTAAQTATAVKLLCRVTLFVLRRVAL